MRTDQWEVLEGMAEGSERNEPHFRALCDAVWCHELSELKETVATRLVGANHHPDSPVLRTALEAWLDTVAAPNKKDQQLDNGWYGKTRHRLRQLVDEVLKMPDQSDMIEAFFCPTLSSRTWHA